MVDIRSRLKDLQDSYGSYASLARSMRVNRSTVARWASGSRKPSKRDRKRINDRWRRSSKRIRNEGATINLTSSFRRLWYRTDIGINRPLNYRKVPRYNWPNKYEVRILIVFRSVKIINEEGFEEDFIDSRKEDGEPSLAIGSIRPSDDLAALITQRFEEYVEKLTAKEGSNAQIVQIVMDRVLLQSAKPKPKPKKKE